MGGIFGGSSPSPPPPPPPPPPPTKSDADVQAAALAARQRRAAALGRSDTIKTSGQGVLDETDTPTKQLLGS
jgi:hypothetical protein